MGGGGSSNLFFFFYESRKEGHMLIFFLSFEKMLEVVERLKKLYDMTGQTKKLYEVSHPTELTIHLCRSISGQYCAVYPNEIEDLSNTRNFAF